MLSRNKVIISTNQNDFFSELSALFAVNNIDAIQAQKDGKVLCEMIAEHEPDIVLMNVFMPNFDAVGVIKHIKKTSSSKLPYFFTISSFDSPTLEKELMANNVDYFFLKPVETSLIVERIISLISNKNSSINAMYSKSLFFNEQDIEQAVTDIIHQIGVPAHIKGYNYLRDSIILVIKNPQMINSVTKKLYTTVADKNGTTSSRVERAIRHAIEVAWDRGDLEVLNSYFGYTIHNQRGKPTNSEFIAMISDRLRLSTKKLA